MKIFPKIGDCARGRAICLRWLVVNELN